MKTFAIQKTDYFLNLNAINISRSPSEDLKEEVVPK